MTTDEWNEYHVVYQTRLSILCGTAEPTDAQAEIARLEADATMERMRHEIAT